MARWDYTKMSKWYDQLPSGRLSPDKKRSLDPKVHPNVVTFIDPEDTNAMRELEGELKEAQGLTKAQAAVVPIQWLLTQLGNCIHNGQETIRIAAGREGRIYIEMWQNPGGWGNDWPKVDVP